MKGMKKNKLHQQDKDIDYIADTKSHLLANTPPSLKYTLYIIAIFLILAFVWAKYAKLDEVTVSPGTVLPTSHIQIIQNLEGGIIKSINVKEGEAVKKAQVLLQLDSTRFSASYKESYAKYVNLLAENIRLQAQASNEKQLHFTEKMKVTHPNMVNREKKLFRANMFALKENLDVLNDSYKSYEKELAVVRPLSKRGVVSDIEVLQLERTAFDIKRQYQEKKSEFKTKSLEELNQNKSEVDRLTEVLEALKDRMHRTTITSPVDGIVNNITINTIGGVIQPGKDIMEIVPQDTNLLIEAKVSPANIAFIRPGQDATIKFDAYDYLTYGGLKAIVVNISPGTIMSPDGTSYYEVKLKSYKNYLGTPQRELPIIPGMTATVDILTGKKTVLDYILKPIFRAKYTALREK